jgi:hypothetical protein
MFEDFLSFQLADLMDHASVDAFWSKPGALSSLVIGINQSRGILLIRPIESNLIIILCCCACLLSIDGLS